MEGIILKHMHLILNFAIQYFNSSIISLLITVIFVEIIISSRNVKYTKLILSIRNFIKK